MESIVHRFAGTWRGDDSVIEYSFSIRGEPIAVRGVDASDGEELCIQDVVFDGSELRFTSICPSTSYALRHVFRLVDGDRIEHEYTRTEYWHRKGDSAA